MSARRYTVAEELMLACPFAITGTACDRSGCDGDASWLIVGAALCSECAAEFGIVAGAVYSVPLDELTGGAEWRDARRSEYDDLVAAFGTRERDETNDRVLAELVHREISATLAAFQLAPAEASTPEDE